MEKNQFTRMAPGELVPISNPPSVDVAVAFVPKPLPPDGWDWPTTLWPLLLQAHKALASLNGVGKHLRNPEIVLSPIQQREAQLSSQLEGTFTNPAQQVLFQVDPKAATSAQDPTNAYREVFNYAQALRLRLDPASPEGQLPLSKRLIKRLHGVLMNGVRGQQHRAGEFRRIQNQIGHPARFVPPPPTVVEPLMDEFERYLNSGDPAFDPLVRAFFSHYQFETIHPFEDGNGRVGRLLLAVTIAEWCELPRQWLYMSAFFEREKQRYMDLLLRVSTHGDWEGWIRFCLQGVIVQSKDTERRCENLLRLHREFHDRLKGRGSVRLSAIVDDLFFRPVVTVAAVRKKQRVTYPTARADLKKLEALKIVRPLEMQGGVITYYCDQIYNVTYEGVIQ